LLVGGFETITNANGQAIKYYEGTIEQRYLEVGISGLTVAWTFPVAFSSATAYGIFVVGEGSGANYFVPNVVSRTTTGTDGRWASLPAQPNNISWLARGRWY